MRKVQRFPSAPKRAMLCLARQRTSSAHSSPTVALGSMQSFTRCPPSSFTWSLAVGVIGSRSARNNDTSPTLVASLLAETVVGGSLAEDLTPNFSAMGPLISQTLPFRITRSGSFARNLSPGLRASAGVQTECPAPSSLRRSPPSASYGSLRADRKSHSLKL